MIQIRKSKVTEKKSEFPIFAMLWPGIGITVGIACGTALKNIGWGLTLGAIFGGFMSYTSWRQGRKNPGDQNKHDRTI